jgi:hypothetical protein
MRKSLVVAILAAVLVWGCTERPTAGPGSKLPLARLPRGAGVTYVFTPMVGPVLSAGSLVVTTTAFAFPGPVSFSWRGGLLPTQAEDTGRRTLITLSRGKRFEPIFANGEKGKVSATAPWLSAAVYRDLAAARKVSGFFEAGLSVSGQVAGGSKGIDLVRDKGLTYFVCPVDGRPTRIRAIAANEAAFVIADDAADPLVLEYQTLGAGWRLTEVRR